MRPVHHLFTLILTVSLAVSCTNPANTKTPTITTKVFETDGAGFIQFTTNDKKYLDYTFWDLFFPIAPATTGTLTTLAGSTKKVSGGPQMPWAVAFCSQSTANIDNTYLLAFKTDGQFAVVVQDTTLTDGYAMLVNWTTCPSLPTSAGPLIEYQIVRSPVGVFTITLNGTTVTGFTDTRFSKDTVGFVTMIGSSTYEKFPDVAEDLRFNLTLPYKVPSTGKSLAPWGYQSLEGDSLGTRPGTRPF